MPPGVIAMGPDPSKVADRNKVADMQRTSVEEGYKTALGARSMLVQIGQMRSTLDDAAAKGNYVAGPTTSTREYLQTLALAAGIGSDKMQEWVESRAAAVQQAAALALKAAEALRGSGAVSNFERELVASAAAGNVDKLNVGQFQRVLKSIEIANRASIDNYNTIIYGKANPEFFAGELGKYKVDLPEDRTFTVKPPEGTTTATQRTPSGGRIINLGR